MSFTTSNPLNIVVLAGGISSEREVSLISGRSVAAALKEAGHTVQVADISPGDLSVLEIEGIDIFFSVLHGTFGEDGQLQEIMEDRNLRFVGSGSEASRTAMDKWMTKQICLDNGIAITAGKLLEAKYYEAEDKLALAESLVVEMGLPIVLKPVSEGSSVGVYIEKNLKDLAVRLESFFNEFGDCLVEKFNAGGEYTVGIVCDEVLPVIQIKSAAGFYDYQAKYISNDTKYLFETDLSKEQVEIMQGAALKINNLIGCNDLCRIDFMAEPQMEPQLLEVNTLPGFTDHSLVPKAAAKVGYSMPEICDKIIQNAFKRPIH